ncbi:putative fidgetin-like protein 2 [Acipenser oxyrinchus oxyrinchus]|uniref:Fidgetin n=1 Tax=Acipenser oxyrinchus oxyrinchus TaxID=40147 RepID=A0AAD8CKG7_ACIOX|nr:putative fidgetin-like protein 2 [Acipenser oxyrinchus oxyrinchus]
MHWTPEHAQPLSQWPEQHLDVSSTTSSPAHKSDIYQSSRQRSNYAWANDDISALTASNLLKRYAEKYSGVLDSPYERGGYPDGPFGSLNGQKSESEPWQMPHGAEGSYPITPAHDGLAGAKTPAATPGAPSGAGGSSVGNGNLSDPGGYTAVLGGPASQEYTSPYNGAYLSSGYCTQPSTALPPAHPAALHTYPSQPGLGPGYSGVHPPPPYLPSGIAAPTPLPPSSRAPGVVGSYGYQSHNLTPLPLVPDAGGGGGGSSLKRKAFEMVVEEEDGSRYRKYGYEQPKTTSGSPYHLSEKGANDCRGNGFGASGEGQSYKTAKTPQQPPAVMVEEHVGKYGSQPMKALVSPSYSNAGEYSPPSEELLKSADPRVVELVTNEIVDRGPPVQWSDIAGQAQVKAAIEEELLWPILRPGAYTAVSRPPKTILLFGPRGGGKTLLGRCVSTQLGATLFRVSGAALVSKWKGDGEEILRTVFLMAGCRQPSVVFVSEVESLLSGEEEGGLKPQLLSYLEAQGGGTGVVVVCSTRRPDDLDEAAHRRFAKHFYISLPDSGVRRQILHHALAQQSCCLSEREIASVLQRTEGYSGIELVQLCQQAAASAGQIHGLPGQLQPTSYKDFESAFCKVRPNASQKELDMCVEWNKMYSSSQ